MRVNEPVRVNEPLLTGSRSCWPTCVFNVAFLAKRSVTASRLPRSPTTPAPWPPRGITPPERWGRGIPHPAVTFDTLPSDIDTLLAADKGSNVKQLTLVTGNDDAAPGQTVGSKITFRAVAGTTSKIAIDGRAGAEGITVLHYSMS